MLKFQIIIIDQIILLVLNNGNVLKKEMILILLIIYMDNIDQNYNVQFVIKFLLHLIHF